MWVWAPEHMNGGPYVCVLITRLSPLVHPCRPSSERSAGQALPCRSPGYLLRPPQPRWSSPAQARLGSAAGLGDYSLFSASLFKAQLSVVPEGPSPPKAAACRAARELGRCISHCCRDAGPGGPGCFPAQLWLFLHALWAPSWELLAQAPHTLPRLLLPQGPFQLWARWGPLGGRLVGWVLEPCEGTWAHSGEATAQWVQNPGLPPPACLAHSESWVAQCVKQAQWCSQALCTEVKAVGRARHAGGTSPSAEALSPPGLPTDPAFHPDLRASGCGEAHHPGRSQLAAASVGPAWLRVPLPHPRKPSPRHRPALQQLQPAVPKLLGEARGLPGAPCAAQPHGLTTWFLLLAQRQCMGRCGWDGSEGTPDCVGVCVGGGLQGDVLRAAQIPGGSTS